MEKAALSALLEGQRAYFATGETFSVDFRLAMLKKLYDGIEKHENALLDAVQKDLGKCPFEAFMCEIGMLKTEIAHTVKHLKKWARPTRVKTPLAQFPAKSYTIPCPFGNVLIMSPWNYPLLLTLGPLVDAMAAGNTAVVKPSAYAPATSAAIANLLGELFPASYIAVVTGGRQENEALLSEKFDLIFFTGSSAVGKIVLRHAAEHLTPTVLELGGKSPTIVDETADIALAARRIVFGKYLNCGQTCVAPDYILCQKSVKDKLAKAIKAEIVAQYGTDPFARADYGKIINEKHFDRLLSLIDGKKVAHGGENRRETRQIAPTVMVDVTPADAVMGEEIFGPILPILTFDDFAEIYNFIGSRPKPLALYLFSKDKKRIKDVTRRIAFGGGCVNDTIVHLATTEMGFGGVGESGMGTYHGKDGFETFSHRKSILDKSLRVDMPMRYRPYREKWEKMIKKIMK